MIAWLHAHALAAVVIALFAGFNGGVILTCLFVSGRDSTVRWGNNPNAQRDIVRMIERSKDRMIRRRRA